MELKKYFEQTKGVGVLATADSSGHVDAAIYARPNFMEENCLVLIMRDRLTHKNLESNPYAAYLFMEDGPGYQGKRLFLKKIGEGQSKKMLETLSRRKYFKDDDEKRFLVFFEVMKELPLIGADTKDKS